MTYQCKCCGIEISKEQWDFCNLCGLCDTGRCQRPVEYHKLQKRILELEAQVFGLGNALNDYKKGKKEMLEKELVFLKTNIDSAFMREKIILRINEIKEKLKQEGGA